MGETEYGANSGLPLRFDKSILRLPRLRRDMGVLLFVLSLTRRIPIVLQGEFFTPIFLPVEVEQGYP